MKTNLDQIKAGADIHAGDGGYSLGTQEAHDEFVKNRNRSLAKARFRDLAIQTDIWCDQNWHDESTYNLAWEDKFAELIVKECAQVVDTHEPLNTWTKRYSTLIKEHFGVEL